MLPYSCPCSSSLLHKLLTIYFFILALLCAGPKLQCCAVLGKSCHGAIYLYSLSAGMFRIGSCIDQQSSRTPHFFDVVGNGSTSKILLSAEPAFADQLRRPGIDFQPGWPVRQPYFSSVRSGLHRLAKSIPRNRFTGSINVYKYGLRQR